MAESTAARDRAIEAERAAIQVVEVALDNDCHEARRDAVTAVHALLARPEVLRALAGVPDVAAAIRAKAADEAIAMCCDGTGECGIDDCRSDAARLGGLEDAADLVSRLLGATNPPEEGNR